MLKLVNLFPLIVTTSQHYLQTQWCTCSIFALL